MNPRLPTELFDVIIYNVWFLPLSTDERIIFMTSAPLVNKTWLVLFWRLSYKHVHIPCSSYLDHFFNLLIGIHKIPRILCQSISITVDHFYPNSLRDTPMMRTLCRLLYSTVWHLVSVRYPSSTSMRVSTTFSTPFVSVSSRR